MVYSRFYFVLTCFWHFPEMLFPRIPAPSVAGYVVGKEHEENNRKHSYYWYSLLYKMGSSYLAINNERSGFWRKIREKSKTVVEETVETW